MALHPSKFNGQERLQPGARGEMFQANQPGYRNQVERVNRTNNKLNTSQHDVPNIKYQFDYRLPVLFTYGFAHGFNQMCVTKGRIVAVDPFMDLVDFDMKKQHNTLTLANGGVPVRLRETGDLYPVLGGAPTDIVEVAAQGLQVSGVGKEWAPLLGFVGYSDKAFRSFYDHSEADPDDAFKGPLTQLLSDPYTIDNDTGKIIATAAHPTLAEGTAMDNVRPWNIPIGMMQRNEYTRDDDAYNGMMPGPVLTDALVELPWFMYKNKAEENPWGSAYGGLFPGALLKSDENGRVVLSPLSSETEMARMGVIEYELERQQVIGQVYSVNNDLLPEGAARWATWALEDRLKFNEFNPDVWRQNNRRGEDAIANSPYQSENKYPGYPYDKAYKNSDLHMLSSTARSDVYDQRMNQQYQYENLGIPGLTDGKNVHTRNYDPVVVAWINQADAAQDYVEMFFRTSEVDVENLQIGFGAGAMAPATVGALVLNNSLRVKYADPLQGIISLEVVDRAILEAEADMVANGRISVKLSFSKKGLAGVPTFMDWDGCVGSIKVLLTK